MTITTQPQAAQDGLSANGAPFAADDPRDTPAGAQSGSGVNGAFKPAGRRQSKHDVDDWAYAQMVERHIRVLGARAAEADASVWADLVRLHAVIDEVAKEAAAKLHARRPPEDAARSHHDQPVTYSQFAAELGCTPQNIYQRYFK
jgi:hypothetical protein